MVTIYFDGLCEPRNPGGLGCFGFSIHGLTPPGEPVVAAGVAGEGEGMTNNVAEYVALGKALAYLVVTKPAIDRLVILGDSKLVIEQLVGRWQCNVPRLADLRDACRERLKQLGLTPEQVTAQWIPREQNVQADSLSRAAYVGRVGKPVPERGAVPDRVRVPDDGRDDGSPLEWHRRRVLGSQSGEELAAVWQSLDRQPDIQRQLEADKNRRKAELAAK